MADNALKNRDDFRLAEWLVQPGLNLLSRDESSVQIEPKMMDVLVFLASKAGDVVSKDQIIDTVWATQFVSESVITRAIAGLRRALGDKAHNPRFIATISKRGYRLLPPTAPACTSTPAQAGVSRPFVVGQWVRGERFYGRSAQINEILTGPRDSIWLLGTRSIGKTSMLRHLELLTAENQDYGFVPLYWDMQGAATGDELNTLFNEGLLDAEERFSATGVETQELCTDDLFASISQLRRLVQKTGRRLLLLCDEVEELIHLHETEPSLLRKLRRALQSNEGIRSVIASSPRLWALTAQRDPTSPFLHGFTPPLYLAPLLDEEAIALVFQRQAPQESRFEIDDRAATTILERCGNHPFLLQLVCSQLLELGDADAAVDRTSADRAAAFFFAVDFDLLGETEKSILEALASTQRIEKQELTTSCSAETKDIDLGLNRLQSLGFIDREEHSFWLVNGLFKEWLHGARRDTGR